jgi:hypothetical protein
MLMLMSASKPHKHHGHGGNPDSTRTKGGGKTPTIQVSWGEAKKLFK